MSGKALRSVAEWRRRSRELERAELAAKGRRKGEAPFDRWTILHVAAGLGFGFFPWSAWLVLGILVAFEVLEAALRRVKPGGEGLFEPESWPNIAADLLVGIGGCLLVRLLTGEPMA